MDQNGEAVLKAARLSVLQEALDDPEHRYTAEMMHERNLCGGLAKQGLLEPAEGSGPYNTEYKLTEAGVNYLASEKLKSQSPTTWEGAVVQAEQEYQSQQEENGQKEDPVDEDGHWAGDEPPWDQDDQTNTAAQQPAKEFKYWKSKGGKRVHIEQMKTSHMINAYKMMCEKAGEVELLLHGIDPDALDAGPALIVYQQKKSYHAWASGWVDSFQQELANRNIDASEFFEEE